MFTFFQHACINRKCMNLAMLVQKNTENECHICGKNFRNGYPLRLHIKNVHEGIKSFKCSSCDRALGKKHASKKYDQFALNTRCFWESTGSKIKTLTIKKIFNI